MPVALDWQHIVVANCQLVSEEGLQAVSAGCPGVQRVGVASCQMVSEEGLQALNAGCLGLQRVDVATCQLVREEGLQAVNAGGLACSTSSLRIASWSARRAFRH